MLTIVRGGRHESGRALGAACKRCCRPPYSAPGVIGVYRYNPCCRSFRRGGCRGGAEGLRDPRFEAIAERFERLLDTAGIAAMDEAPRRCPGCCGGCRNVYAMRDALNTLHAGSWRAQANALLSEQGFHCD